MTETYAKLGFRTDKAYQDFLTELTDLGYRPKPDQAPMFQPIDDTPAAQHAEEVAAAEGWHSKRRRKSSAREGTRK